jgi:predicted dehydrogenase
MRVAVAGLGWWGKQIISSLHRSSRFEVLYGVDPTPPAGIAEFAREFHFKLETELGAVLGDPAVDGVVLATPHALHEEQILAGLAAGKNVFCEKPLTMTGAGAARVIAAAEKARKVIGVGHERRWEPAFEEMARLLASGVLGRLLYLDANYSHDMFTRADPGNWRLSPTHAPAGMMTSVGIHLTDLFIVFAGAPAEVRAQTASLVIPAPYEDFLSARILFKSGVRASLNQMAATPFYGRFSIYGDKGWVEIASEANVDQGKPTSLTQVIGGERKTRFYDPTDTVTANFEAWADAVEGRKPYRFTNEQLVANIRLFEAIVTSSGQGGQAVAL